MKRCSFCEWTPILPIPVWPLAWQCSLGQNTVVGSMTLLLAMRGNMTTRSMSGPRLRYNFTAPRLGVELSPWEPPHSSDDLLAVVTSDYLVPDLSLGSDASQTTPPRPGAL